MAPTWKPQEHAEFEGLDKLIGEFEFRGKWARQRTYSLVLEMARELLVEVTYIAMGNPAPDMITGQYVGSFDYDIEGMNEGSAGVGLAVGTNEPYAERLEYGFVGIDKRGRKIHQAPRPHWAPAVDKVVPEYMDKMELVADFETDFRGVG